jgi:hypothetical protein
MPAATDASVVLVLSFPKAASAAGANGHVQWHRTAMEFIVLLHGHNRWLVALVWAVLAVQLVVGAVRSMPRRWARLTLLGLLALFALQLLLGIALFVWRWEGLAQVPHYRWEHVVTMLAALLLLHLPLRWKRLEEPLWWRRTLWVVLAVGVLVFLGVARLPKGWLG